MLVIVCYDVNTETRAGRRRLRRVAKVCEGTGQRVQKSVFECQVDLMQLEELERRLLAEIDIGRGLSAAVSSSRYARLRGARARKIPGNGLRGSAGAVKWRCANRE